MASAHALRTYPLDEANHLATPSTSLHASMATPAREILTDYSRYRPLLVESTLPVPRCEELMRKSHVKLMLVVDTQDHLLGIVDLVDLVGPKLQKMIGPDLPKTEVAVGSLMTSRDELKSIAFEDLQHATIGDLVVTLQHEHCPHILVQDRSRNEIRGVISAADIARCLDVPLDITYSPTFADICHVTQEHLYT